MPLFSNPFRRKNKQHQQQNDTSIAPAPARPRSVYNSPSPPRVAERGTSLYLPNFSATVGDLPGQVASGGGYPYPYYNSHATGVNNSVSYLSPRPSHPYCDYDCDGAHYNCHYDSAAADADATGYYEHQLVPPPPGSSTRCSAPLSYPFPPPRASSSVPFSRFGYAHQNNTALTFDSVIDLDQEHEHEHEHEHDQGYVSHSHPHSVYAHFPQSPPRTGKNDNDNGNGNNKPPTSLRTRFGSFVDLTLSRKSKPTPPANAIPRQRGKLTSRSVLGLPLPKKMSVSTVHVNVEREELWSSPYEDEFDMPLPPVPPRSRLRAVAPPPIRAPGLEASTSLYHLPVDPPPHADDAPTPSLSSGSSSDHEGGESPELSRSPVVEVFTFGRKKRSSASVAGFGSSSGPLNSRDPQRVRDGALPRGSQSGVYTPRTFPGPSGSRPSISPTGVYTPTSFTLYPVQPEDVSAGPSRSASLSSSSSDISSAPRTPASPSLKWSSAMSAGIRRFSSNIVSPRDSTASASSTTSYRNISAPMPTSAPATDSYFTAIPKAPTHSNSHTRTSSWNQPTMFPATGNLNARVAGTGAYPAGLGIGLSETAGRTSTPTSVTPVPRARAMSAAGEGPKGRRKPVPKVDELEVEIAKLDVQEEAHAL